MSDIISAEQGKVVAERLLEQAKGVEVTDEHTASGMTALVEYASSQLKRLEDARVALTKPLNKQVRFINDQFRGTREAFEAVKNEGRARLKPYLVRLDEQRRAAEEAERKRAEDEARKAMEKRIEAERADAEARAAAEAVNPLDEPPPPTVDEYDADPSALQAELYAEPEPPPPPAPIEKPKAPRGAQGKAARTRKVKKWRLIDKSELPDEYLMVDTAALNKAVKGGATKIPGIEIYEDAEVVVK